jgi:small subunit ribosomal protein S15
MWRRWVAFLNLPCRRCSSKATRSSSSSSFDENGTSAKDSNKFGETSSSPTTTDQKEALNTTSFNQSHEQILDELIQRISITIDQKRKAARDSRMNATTTSSNHFSVSSSKTTSTSASPIEKHQLIESSTSSTRSLSRPLEKDSQPSPDYEVGHFRISDLINQLRLPYTNSAAKSKVGPVDSKSQPSQPSHEPLSLFTPIEHESKSAGKKGDPSRSASADSTVPSEMTMRLLSSNIAPAREWRQKRVAELMDRFRTRSTDTGRTEVQIAAMTGRIDHLTIHLQKHRKDTRTQRAIHMLVLRRRLLLKYLRNEGLERYALVCRSLGIRPPK